MGNEYENLRSPRPPSSSELSQPSHAQNPSSNDENNDFDLSYLIKHMNNTQWSSPVIFSHIKERMDAMGQNGESRFPKITSFLNMVYNISEQVIRRISEITFSVGRDEIQSTIYSNLCHIMGDENASDLKAEMVGLGVLETDHDKMFKVDADPPADVFMKVVSVLSDRFISGIIENIIIRNDWHVQIEINAINYYDNIHIIMVPQKLFDSNEESENMNDAVIVIAEPTNSTIPYLFSHSYTISNKLAYCPMGETWMARHGVRMIHIIENMCGHIDNLVMEAFEIISGIR